MKLLCRLTGHRWQDEGCEATCSRCGLTKGPGHRWQGGECEAACETCGRTKGPGHDWRGNSCESVCSRCQKKQGTGHRWKGDSCVSTCARCKQTKGPGHNWRYVQDLTPDPVDEEPETDEIPRFYTLIDSSIYSGLSQEPRERFRMRLEIPNCDQVCQRCGQTRTDHRWRNSLDGIRCSRCHEAAPPEIAAALKLTPKMPKLDPFEFDSKKKDYDPWKGPIVSAKGSMGCSS